MKNARKSPVIGSVAILLLTVLAYLPVMRGGFIWDDDSWTTGIAALLRNGSGLRTMWLQPTALQQYYPLSGTTFWLDYHLWGFWTPPYHVENVLLHALSAVLFWQLLRRLEMAGAWLAGAVFAVHPVMVESVAWITERKNVLSLVLYLGALLAYGRFRAFWKENGESPARHRGAAYALSLLLCLGALLAKTTAFSLPAAILLIGWWKRGRVRWREDVLPTLPMFAMAIGLCLMTARLEKTHVGARGPEFALTFAERWLIAGRAVWFYIGKLLWPANLSFVYPRWQLDTTSWWQWLYPVAAVGVLVALWVARRQIGRGPVTGAFFFVGTLFPLLGFFNAYGMRYSFVWDHWVYLPSLSIIALAVAAGSCVVWQASARIVVGAAVVMVLGMLSWEHGAVFDDEETLWRDVLTRNPGCLMAHNNLATVLIARGNLAGALAQCEEALRIRPEDPVAHDNWGSILLQMGKPREAIEQYGRAVAIEPDNPEAQYNYGSALFHLGRVEEAIGHYQQAVRIDPNLAAAQYNLGNALLHVGRPQEAIGHYEQAVRIFPDDAEAYNKLGTALALVGRVRESITQYEEGLRLKPDNLEAENNLAWLLATVPSGQGGDPVRAMAIAQRACDQSGRHMAVQLDTLAVAYAAAGRFEEAINVADECVTAARAAGQTQLVVRVQAQIDLFRAGQPYRGRTDSR